MFRKLAKMLALLAGALLVLAAVLVLRFWAAGSDLPPVEDEDMRLKRVDISPDANAFTQIQEAAGKLTWPEDEDSRLHRIFEEEATDWETVAALLSRNQEALRSLEEGLKLERLQLPPHGPTDEAPYGFIAWRRLGQLLRLRSRSNMEKGNAIEARDDAIRLLRLGHLAEGARGGLNTYLLGNALKSWGLDELRRSVAETAPSSEELGSLLDRTESLRPNEQSFRESLQFDYSYMADLIDDPQRLYSDDEVRFQQDRQRWKAMEDSSLISRYIYQKNATKKLYIDNYRAIASSWERDCSQVEFPDRNREKSSLLSAIWEPNIVGRTMASIGATSLWNLLNGKCAVQTEFSATQALLALRAFQADHGQLPPSLDSLIADYLPSVAVDGFDGGPLRYSQNDRLVYSVGKDLVDDGGDPEKDKTFPIRF